MTDSETKAGDSLANLVSMVGRKYTARGTLTAAPSPSSVAQADPVRPKHYESEIDPYKFALANKLGFLESNIVKYVTRWQKKDGLTDLRKALETIQRLIEWEEDQTRASHGIHK